MRQKYINFFIEIPAIYCISIYTVSFLNLRHFSDKEDIIIKYL